MLSGFVENLKNSCKNWWLLLILGILCIIAGIAVLCSPAGGTVAIAIILSIALIVGSILGIIFVISNRKEIPAWGWNLVLPILVLIAGIILLCNTGASVVFVLCFFAVGILFQAVETICVSISMSKVEGSGWGWTLALGIIGLLIAFTLFANPLFSMIMVSVFAGISLLFAGIESIAVSVQLSKMRSAMKKEEAENK